MTRRSDPILGAPSNTVDQIIDEAALGDHHADISDRRGQTRHPFESFVGLILVDYQHKCSDPIVLKAKNLSIGGLCVYSKQPLEAGNIGVVQLMRSNGQYALIGVEIRHCHYIEDQSHIAGLRFIPFPKTLKREGFFDQDGRLRLFHPLLKENIVD